MMGIKDRYVFFCKPGIRYAGIPRNGCFSGGFFSLSILFFILICEGHWRRHCRTTEVPTRKTKHSWHSSCSLSLWASVQGQTYQQYPTVVSACFWIYFESLRVQVWFSLKLLKTSCRSNKKSFQWDSQALLLNNHFELPLVEEFWRFSMLVAPFILHPGTPSMSRSNAHVT